MGKRKEWNWGRPEVTGMVERKTGKEGRCSENNRFWGCFLFTMTRIKFRCHKMQRKIRIVGMVRGLRFESVHPGPALPLFVAAGYHVSRAHVTFGRLSVQPV